MIAYGSLQVPFADLFNGKLQTTYLGVYYILLYQEGVAALLSSQRQQLGFVLAHYLSATV